MADQTESSVSIAAAPSTVMGVIADVESYPAWSSELREVTVLDPGRGGRPARVRFRIDAGVLRDTYTLDYTWDGDRAVSWTLVEAGMLTAMDGSYALTPSGDGTQVRYRLTVDVAVPMLGVLKRKAEKVIVDRALQGLRNRVENP